MERITNYAPDSTNENKVGCTQFHSTECEKRLGLCDGCPINERAWKRLAMYEDTGLLPEVVTEIKRLLEEKRIIRLPIPLGDNAFALVKIADEFKLFSGKDFNVCGLFKNGEGNHVFASLCDCFPNKDDAIRELTRRIQAENENGGNTDAKYFG